MDYNEYQKKAWTTCLEQCQSLAYLGLGIGDEAGEVAEATTTQDILKELGDVCWYISGICTMCGIELNKVSKRISRRYSEPEFQLLIHASKVQGLLKKQLRDGKLNNDKLFTELKNVFKFVDFIARKNNSSINEVMKMNIDKLFSRKERGVIQGNGDNR